MKKNKFLLSGTLLLSSAVILAACSDKEEVKLQTAEVYLEDGSVKKVQAEDINTVLYFFIDEGETITLTGYRGVNKNIVIPEKINGKPVTKIQSAIINEKDEVTKASFNNLGLTSVKFPSTIKEIGAFAFYQNALVSVKIPGSVEVVAESVFANNFIETVELEDGVKEINKNAFANNYITKLSLSPSLERIGENAFSNNRLTKLEINENLIVINDKAFKTNQIEQLIIPKTAALEVINNEAFAENLVREIDFNDNIKDIGSDAFLNNRVNKVVFPKTVENIYENAFAKNQMPLRSFDLAEYPNTNVSKKSFDKDVVFDSRVIEE